MTSKELDQKLNELLGIMDDWIENARIEYICFHMEEIERMAAEFEVTCDYIIMEFI